MKPYLRLFVLAVLVGVVTLLAARTPRPTPPADAAATADTVTLRVEIGSDHVIASRTSVPSGALVVLEIANSSTVARRVRLAGYEDRVDTGALAGGDAARITFVADRPGDRFAWLVDEQAQGRLDVTGAHLVEGHR